MLKNREIDVSRRQADCVESPGLLKSLFSFMRTSASSRRTGRAVIFGFGKPLEDLRHEFFLAPASRSERAIFAARASESLMQAGQLAAFISHESYPASILQDSLQLAGQMPSSPSRKPSLDRSTKHCKKLSAAYAKPRYASLAEDFDAKRLPNGLKPADPLKKAATAAC